MREVLLARTNMETNLANGRGGNQGRHRRNAPQTGVTKLEKACKMRCNRVRAADAQERFPKGLAIVLACTLAGYCVCSLVTEHLLAAEEQNMPNSH